MKTTIALLLAVALSGCSVDVGAEATSSGGVTVDPFPFFEPREVAMVYNDTDHPIFCEVETNAGRSSATIHSGSQWGIAIHTRVDSEWMVVDCGEDGFWRLRPTPQAR